MKDNSHPNRNNPVLNQNEIEKILKIIQAVYNSDSPARDSVFNKYEIHARYCYSFNSVSLRVKPNEPGVVKLAKDEIPTGEESLDEVLNRYSLDSVKTAYSYPDFPWLTIFTSEEYNMIPISKELEKIPSIEIAEFSRGCIGDGSNISLIRNKSSAIITFSIGHGDCPAGCIYHKYWEFIVKNGEAKFVRAYEN